MLADWVPKDEDIFDFGRWALIPIIRGLERLNTWVMPELFGIEPEPRCIVPFSKEVGSFSVSMKISHGNEQVLTLRLTEGT